MLFLIGSEKKLEKCTNHEWLLAALTKDGKPAPCYTHQSKAIHCTSLTSKQDSTLDINQDSSQGNKQESSQDSVTDSNQDDNPDVKQDSVKDTNPASKQGSNEDSNPRSKQESDQDSKQDSNQDTSQEHKQDNKPSNPQILPSTPKPKPRHSTFKSVTEADSEVTTEAITSYDALQKAAILSDPAPKDSKPNKVPLIVIVPTQTKTPKPYIKSEPAPSEYTDEHVPVHGKEHVDDHKLSDADEEKASQLENSSEYALVTSTSAVSSAAAVSNTTQLPEITSVDIQDMDTTLSPLDHYLYFKQSDLIPATTMTTLKTTQKTTPEPITKPTLAPTTSPTAVAKLVYMVTPRNYHKPSTAAAVPWAPNPRIKVCKLRRERNPGCASLKQAKQTE